MLLQVSNLSKEFPRPGRRGAVRALEEVSFELEEGDALGVIGESGAGKTTLARCVLALEDPSAGRVCFRGEDLALLSGRRLRRLRRQFQPVFQDPWSSLNPGMSAFRVVEEPLKVHRLGGASARRRRVEELLARVGLAGLGGAKLPAQLSGGQRQRLAIARALATGPGLLVADEAVSFLDPPVQIRILDLLAELKKRHGLAILFVSHALPAVRRLCDRIAVLHEGRIVETGRADELLASPGHPYTRQLLRSAPRLPR